MLSGTAIVATGLSACREVLGDAALYVGPGDVEAIREHLELLAESESECRRLGEAARQRVLDNFTWQQVGQRYHDLFASMPS
jgi:glycosyltransferase involved in cell wall biosynthesis